MEKTMAQVIVTSINIRHGVFETNSSSTHALVIDPDVKNHQLALYDKLHEDIPGCGYITIPLEYYGDKTEKLTTPLEKASFILSMIANDHGVDSQMFYDVIRQLSSHHNDVDIIISSKRYREAFPEIPEIDCHSTLDYATVYQAAKRSSFLHLILDPYVKIYIYRDSSDLYTQYDINVHPHHIDEQTIEVYLCLLGGSITTEYGEYVPQITEYEFVTTPRLLFPTDANQTDVLCSVVASFLNYHINMGVHLAGDHIFPSYLKTFPNNVKISKRKNDSNTTDEEYNGMYDWIAQCELSYDRASQEITLTGELEISNELRWTKVFPFKK